MSCYNTYHYYLKPRWTDRIYILLTFFVYTCNKPFRFLISFLSWRLSTSRLVVQMVKYERQVYVSIRLDILPTSYLPKKELFNHLCAARYVNLYPEVSFTLCSFNNRNNPLQTVQIYEA